MMLSDGRGLSAAAGGYKGPSCRRGTSSRGRKRKARASQIECAMEIE
jgi:hypothetical protein